MGLLVGVPHSSMFPFTLYTIVLATCFLGSAWTSEAPGTPGITAADGTGGKGSKDVGEMKQFLEWFNQASQKVYYTSSLASWTYNTNITEFNRQANMNSSRISTEFAKLVQKKLSKFNWQSLPKDGKMFRQFKLISNPGMSILSREEINEYEVVTSNMETLYSVVSICQEDPLLPCLKLDPDLDRLMAESRDPERLKWAWQAWRDGTGKHMPSDFERMVALLNKAAVKNGYKDMGDEWRRVYEVEDFEEQMQSLFQQIKPMYNLLHKYVARKLKLYYKGKVEFPKSGHIPAHLLGNMWAQTWNNIFPIVKPFNLETKLDVSDKMKEMGYNQRIMFERSEKFFTSIGLKKMYPKFWNNSMISRPKDREVKCHASAWDFYLHNDFRIKMCASVNMEDLITIHHEMGHTEYDIHYAHLPVPFRNGANPGFHEAVGDTMALSVSTPKHLYSIGLLDKVVENKEADINYLLSVALTKIAFLPFGYLIDKYRWRVFDGTTPRAQYTRHWWALRCQYQGVSPPVARQQDDFDPGAKYHIAGNVPYIRYFISYVIQFQFHRALCKEANHKGPLHTCDIGGSIKAGDKLAAMLSMGASEPWPEAMHAITGERVINADAMKEYFKPLFKFLKEEDEKHPQDDWTKECPEGSFKEEGNSASSVFVSLAVISLIATVNLLQHL